MDRNTSRERYLQIDPVQAARALSSPVFAVRGGRSWFGKDLRPSKGASGTGLSGICSARSRAGTSTLSGQCVDRDAPPCVALRQPCDGDKASTTLAWCRRPQRGPPLHRRQRLRLASARLLLAPRAHRRASSRLPEWRSAPSARMAEADLVLLPTAPSIDETPRLWMAPPCPGEPDEVRNVWVRLGMDTYNERT